MNTVKNNNALSAFLMVISLVVVAIGIYAFISIASPEHVKFATITIKSIGRYHKYGYIFTV